MPASPLTPLLDEKLSELAAEVRSRLVVRGCSWVTLAALGCVAVAIGLDVLIGLPAWIRGALLLGGLVGCGVLAWRLVVRPWSDGVPTDELAGLIEHDFPGLSERLITLVELARHTDPGNGSRALMAVLARETDQRARRLEFSRVSPTRSSVRVAKLAAAAVVLAVAQLVLVPGARERIRRVALPWYTPSADISYRILISSGDPVVRRGEPVTLSAYLEPTRPGAALPESATLVIRGTGAKNDLVLAMTAADGAAFHMTLPGAAEDFEYRVEAGLARSDWHGVTAADPVALSSGTSITLHPPGYAGGIYGPQVREGFAEFEVLQYGRAVLDLRFSAAPAEVYLEWRPADPGPRDRLPVRLRDDRLAGTAEIPVPTDGTLVLVLIGDRGLRTELPAAVQAIPDIPPRFEKVSGLTGSARTIRPDDRIPVELAARDDLRLDALRVEYCLNGNEAEVRSEPVSLSNIGTVRAEGAFTFPLAGKAKEGDTVQFRIRASDNRSVPERKLGPQDAVFPPTGWAVLRVAATARPLIEQEVLGQRDAVRGRLAEAMKLVQSATTDATSVREAAPPDGMLSTDQAVRLRRSQELAAEAARILTALADETALTPDLRPLAAAVREVADGPLRAASEALRTAVTDATRAGRDPALTAATSRLAEALAKLTDLDARNDAAAQARLDRASLRQISDDQRALADQASRPDSPTDELVKRQRNLLARLNEAIARSGPLGGAREAAAERQLQDLLSRVRKLAEEESALDRAVHATEQAVRRQRTEELARRQRVVADEAARLAERFAVAARIAGTAAPNRQPFEEAIERLSRGDTDRAMIEQEKSARDLDRLAEGLSRAVAVRGDLREAARQVARWQDDLRHRHADAVARAAGSRLLDDVRKQFLAEQQAVRDVTAFLRRPGDEPMLKRAEQSARDATIAAAEALDRKDADPTSALRRATDALTELANRTLTAEERTRQAQVRLDEFRNQQDDIAREADEAIRRADRDAVGQKLDAAAARQVALARKIRLIDVPGHESRRDSTADAAERAAADLRSGYLPDVPISQQEARRRLDRLRQALGNLTTPDDDAIELAKLQRDVADNAAGLPARPTADQLQPLQQRQREITRRLGALSAPEVTGSLIEAKEAVRAGDDETRRADRPEELRSKTRLAADKLTRLAERLTGSESDVERVERLVREREAAADKAGPFERQAPNPEAEASAQRQLLRQLEELDQTRAGKAQLAKQKAAESLQKLRQSGDASRNVLNRDAAAALRRLVDEMAQVGGRSHTRSIGPPAPTDADELRRLAAAGNLPTEHGAATARDLARRQRELRDAVAEAAVDLARGAHPADKDTLGELITEQETIAEAVRALESRLDSMKSQTARRQANEAAGSTRRVADHLRVGSIAGGLDATTSATAGLRGLAGLDASPDWIQEARDLANRQADLGSRLKKLTGDVAIESARQLRRQGELGAETDRLGEALRDAADDSPDSPFKRPAASTALARKQMTQAEEDASAGRARQAADSRRRAGEHLTAAASDLAAAASDLAAAVGSHPGPTPPDWGALTAGSSVRQAGDQMRKADAQLRKGSGTAVEPMRRAADALGQATNSLGRLLGAPSGTPGSPPGSTPRPAAPPPDILSPLDGSWGELPEGTRAKVLQDLTAKYGEDYARAIKLYFESLAERKGPGPHR